MSAASQRSHMAAGQSSPLCVPLGLLLLLIAVISSHRPGVQARPSDFWCNRQARKNMEKRIERLRTDMTGCVGADKLSSPIQLPCVSVQAAEWTDKTLQQKRSEVVGALRVFQDGVEQARNQTTSECQTSLWDKLGHHITNYLAIVNRLQIQNGTVTPSHSSVQNCSSLNSTSEVLKQYRNLLKGKVELLAIDLRAGRSKVEPRTTNTRGPCR